MRDEWGAVPISENVPNAVTREALRQAAEREDLTEYASLEDLKAVHDRHVIGVNCHRE